MTYVIDIEEREATPTVVMQFECTAEEIGERLHEILPRTYAYVGQNGGEPAGAPFMLYHEMGEESWELEAGMPVASPLEGDGDIEASELPGGTVATTIHIGAYDEVGDAHEAIGEWVEENGYRPDGPCWDAYINDPSEVDEGEERTQVYWPVVEAD